MRPNRKEYIVKSKPTDCTQCHKRDKCTALCAEVEAWANQDVVGRNSNLLVENGSGYGTHSEFLDLVSMSNDQSENDRDSDVSQGAWSIICDMRLSEKVTRFIYSYYMLGKRIRDIAIDEGKTSQAIDQRHIQAKKTVRKCMVDAIRWKDRRDRLEYSDVMTYDVCKLYYDKGYPKRVIAKLINKHIMTVVKIISKQNEHLGKIV